MKIMMLQQKSMMKDPEEDSFSPIKQGRGRTKKVKRARGTTKTHDGSTPINDNSGDDATQSGNEDPVADPSVLVKRGRGRPKKGDVVNTKERPEHEKVLPERERRGKMDIFDPSVPRKLPQKKKRGRPKASEPGNLPKKRGRPKIKHEITRSTKKRGRPKGSLGKNHEIGNAEIEKIIDRKINKKLAAKIDELQLVILSKIQEHMMDLSTTLIEDAGAKVTEEITSIMESD